MCECVAVVSGDGGAGGITNGASAAPGGEAVGRSKVGAALARGKAAEPGVGLQARVLPPTPLMMPHCSRRYNIAALNGGDSLPTRPRPLEYP